MFQDWLYQDMTDFESALEYEREHPSWQCEWDESMALAWIQCTEYEADMDLYNEFG